MLNLVTQWGHFLGNQLQAHLNDNDYLSKRPIKKCCIQQVAIFISPKANSSLFTNLEKGEFFELNRAFFLIFKRKILSHELGGTIIAPQSVVMDKIFYSTFNG